MSPACRGLVVVLLWAAPGRARAEEPVDVEWQNVAAKAHFAVGEAAYNEKRYEDALREFQEGYRLSPRPTFLISLAQVNRKLGRRTEAIAHFRAFLAAAG